MPLWTLGILLALASPPAAASSCKPGETDRFIRRPDLGRGILTSLASDPAISDACKKETLGDLAFSGRNALQGSFCVGKRCENYEAAFGTAQNIAETASAFCEPFTAGTPSSSACRLRPVYAQALAQADESLARALDADIKTIEEKLAAQRIPVCLWNHPCKPGQCRSQLLELWWSDFVTEEDGDERWAQMGSFSHLLLADAFSCNQGKQKGGTCAVYSGITLTSHYCSSPLYNPAAAVGCGMAGPDFQCPTAAELLESARQAGIWRATGCFVDKKTGQRVCAAAYDNPKGEEDDALAAKTKAACDGGLAECAILTGRLSKLRFRAGRAAVKEGVAPDGASQKVTVEGSAGASVWALQEVYRKYGFHSAWLYPNEAGWALVLRELRAKHPVQLAVSPVDWTSYSAFVHPKHGVIASGLFKDAGGVERIVIEDSNRPDTVKVLPAAQVKTAFINNGGGAVILCPPADSARCTYKDPDHSGTFKSP